MNDERKMKDVNYGTKAVVWTEKGIIDYDPEKMKDIVGGEKLTYDEYLEIQESSAGHVRGWFQLCYFCCPLGFKGEIEKKNKRNVCFKHIFVEGMYNDGLCFEGKEDHVWMDLKGFKDYRIGDSVSFSAEAYRYLKTGNGKLIDFGLRNPAQVKRVEPYELPGDEELMRQEIEKMVCENCYLNERCDGACCMLPKGARKAKVEEMLCVIESDLESKKDEVL